MADSAYQPTRREFLDIAGLTAAGALVPTSLETLAHGEQQRKYSVSFKLGSKQTSDLWRQYVFTDRGARDNVEPHAPTMDAKGTRKDILEIYNEMRAKGDIPETLVLDSRLENLAQELIRDPTYIQTNFKLTSIIRQGRFSRNSVLYYQNEAQGLILVILAIPAKSGIRPVALHGYSAVELKEHNLVIDRYAQRQGSPYSEIWGVDDKIVTLGPKNDDDKSTVPELDVTGLRKKLSEGIKKQGLTANVNQTSSP